MSRLIASWITCFALSVSPLAAQPIPKEEEDVAGPGAKPVAGAGNVPSFMELARGSDNELAKAKLFERFSIPFDLLHWDNKKTPLRPIAPIGSVWVKIGMGNIEVIPLTTTRRGGLEELKRVTLAAREVVKIEHYELLVLEAVEDYLKMPLYRRDPKSKNYLPRRTQWKLAADALAAVLAWHDKARADGTRGGEGWPAVRDKVLAKYAELRAGQAKLLIERGLIDDAAAAAAQLERFAPRDQRLTRMKARVALIRANRQTAPRSPLDQYFKLREAVDRFAPLLPAGEADKDLSQARAKLSSKARQIKFEATNLLKKKEIVRAKDLLKTVGRLDPKQAGEASQMRRTLVSEFPILYVGVRGLPERMSPAAMRTDADRAAVGLIFQSLLCPVPSNGLGACFAPELAASMPEVGASARTFRLRPDIQWGTEDGQSLDPRDVRETLNLLRRVPHSAAAARVAGLQAESRSPDSVLLRLDAGRLRPLSAMDFQVLPARWMQAKGLSPYSEAFYRRPVGSGPFRYLGPEVEKDGRKCAVFRASPAYGVAAGRVGLPLIAEVRLFDHPNDPANVGEAVDGRRAHVYLDVKTSELGQFRRLGRDPARSTRIATYTERGRIHILAVNHLRLPLQNVSLRRGLSAAIDRDAVVNSVFRKGLPPLRPPHRVLKGPFPPGTWAEPTAATALHSKADARQRLDKAVKEVGRVTLKLAYFADDPEAAEACRMIEEQVEALAPRTVDGPGVDIVAEPLPRQSLYAKLYDDRMFDLAYVPHDYADTLYDLRPLMDPRGVGRGGRNYMSYLAAGAGADAEDRRLLRMLDRAARHRQFSRLRPAQHDAFAKFNDRLPFVPLWQLDRHTVFIVARVSVKTPNGRVTDFDRIDPGHVFTHVARWELR